MTSNSLNTIKNKSPANISMTNPLPKRKINLNNIGRQSITAVKNYLGMKKMNEIVMMTISLGKQQTGLRIPLNLEKATKKILKYWSNEINNEIDYNREQKKERDSIERAKKTALNRTQNKIKGVVSSKFNSITLYRKSNNNSSHSFKVDFTLDALNTQKITLNNFIEKASSYFDNTIGELIRSSPLVAYKLPNGMKVIITPTKPNETAEEPLFSSDFNFKDYITFTPAPTKKTKSKIKLAGAMELDSFIKNDVWDTGTNKCVPDWIIYKYSQVKGFKKICNYESIEKYSIMGMVCEDDEEAQPNTYGYTIDHIRNLCRNMEINLYILNDGRLQIYDTQDKVKRNIPLVIEVKNNHLYPVVDKHIIKKMATMASGTGKKKADVKTDKFQETTKENEEITKKIFNTENMDSWDWMAKTMKDTNTMVYREENLTIINNQLQKFKLNGDTYISNYDEELHSYFGDDYKGQNEISILTPYIKDIKKSYLNHDVKEALFLENVKNRTHYGVCTNEEVSPNDESVKKYDINKHYKSVMMNPFDDWIQFDFNSTITECVDFNNNFGLYFVETDDMTLLHKNNWYSNTILKYAKDNGVDFVCKNFIKGKRQSKNMLKDIIELIEKDIDDVCVRKLIINAISGYMGKTHSSHVKAIIDTDDNTLWDSFIKLRNVEKKQMFWRKLNNMNVVGEKTTRELTNNNLPVYIQILDFANMVLHKHIKDIGGLLVARKTDAFWIHEPENEPILNKEIGGLKEEAKSHVGQMSCDRNVEYTHEKKEFQDLLINDSDDYNKIIEQTKKTSIQLLGRAGVGKTYVLKHIKEHYGNKCVCLAFTNKATNNLGGQTIHNWIGINDEGKINGKYYNQKLNNIEVIIVDEISMLNVELWKIFEMIKTTKPSIRFVLSGDYRQLPPIEEEGLYDYFNHDVIKYICDYTRVELTKIKRYDNELYEFSEKIWNDEIDGHYLLEQTKNNMDAIYHAECNIVWTNRTRKNINKRCNEWNSKKAVKSLLVEYTGDENKYNENIILYDGVKLLCNATNKALDIRKNETLIVDRFDDENIYIGEKVIPITRLHQLFILGYAITCYKAQGDTYDGVINIFEIEKLMVDKRFLYTAVTRTRNFKNINLM